MRTTSCRQDWIFSQPRVHRSLHTLPFHTSALVPQPKTADGVTAKARKPTFQASYQTSPVTSFLPLLWGTALPVSLGTARTSEVLGQTVPCRCWHHRQILTFVIISSSFHAVLLLTLSSSSGWRARKGQRGFTGAGRRMLAFNLATPCGMEVALKDSELLPPCSGIWRRLCSWNHLGIPYAVGHSSGTSGVFHKLGIYWDLQIKSGFPSSPKAYLLSWVKWLA